MSEDENEVPQTPTPPPPASDPEERQVQVQHLGYRLRRLQVRRSWWLWTFSILDVVLAVAIFEWNSSREKVAETVKEAPQLTTTSVDRNGSILLSIVKGTSLLSQFLMGMMLFIALAIPSDKLLLCCLRIYYVGSWVLLIQNFFVVIISTILTIRAEADTFRYEDWMDTFANLMVMFLRFFILMIVQELSGVFMSLQDSYERWLNARNARRAESYEMAQQNPVNAMPPSDF